MIDLGTLGGLHARDHEIHVYCVACDRWQVIDLAGLVAQGQGDRRLPVRFRCRDCGERAINQIRPPMPARSSTGWIAPPDAG